MIAASFLAVAEIADTLHFTEKYKL